MKYSNDYTAAGTTLQAQKAGQEGEAQLQLQAFEAINEMVRSASADTLQTVQQLIPVVLSRLGSTFQPPSGSVPSQERLSDLQVPNPCLYIFL